MKLISKEYRRLNRVLHRRPRGFGGSGHRWVKSRGTILSILKEFEIKSLLDYGCGQSTLWLAMKENHPKLAKRIMYREYDPCVPGKDLMPVGRYDLVVSTDVLEHIEPEYLDNVIIHIFSFAIKVVFLNISMIPAIKVLPDGRNAHLIVKPQEWWMKKLRKLVPGWRFEPLVAKICKYRGIPKDLNVRCIKC